MRVTGMDNEELVEPAWGFAMDDYPEPVVKWLTPPSGYEHVDEMKIYTSIDTWDVPSAEDWPDHICVEMARFKLEYEE